jgi:hypothetical protein
MKGKGMIKMSGACKEDERSELSPEASKGLDDVRTKVHHQLWEEQQGSLMTVAAASGV